MKMCYISYTKINLERGIKTSSAFLGAQLSECESLA